MTRFARSSNNAVVLLRVWACTWCPIYSTVITYLVYAVVCQCTLNVVRSILLSSGEPASRELLCCSLQSNSTLLSPFFVWSNNHFNITNLPRLAFIFSRFSEFYNTTMRPLSVCYVCLYLVLNYAGVLVFLILPFSSAYLLLSARQDLFLPV